MIYRSRQRGNFLRSRCPTGHTMPRHSPTTDINSSKSARHPSSADSSLQTSLLYRLSHRTAHICLSHHHVQRSQLDLVSLQGEHPLESQDAAPPIPTLTDIHPPATTLWVPTTHTHAHPAGLPIHTNLPRVLCCSSCQRTCLSKRNESELG